MEPRAFDGSLNQTNEELVSTRSANAASIFASFHTKYDSTFLPLANVSAPMIFTVLPAVVAALLSAGLLQLVRSHAAMVFTVISAITCVVTLIPDLTRGLHEWMFATRWRGLDEPGGSDGIDNAFVRQHDTGIDAERGATHLADPECHEDPHRWHKRGMPWCGANREGASSANPFVAAHACADKVR